MPPAGIADTRSAGWHDGWQSTASPPLGNWPACRAVHNTDDAPPPSGNPSWEMTYRRLSMPQSARAARSSEAPPYFVRRAQACPRKLTSQRNAEAPGAVLKPLRERSLPRWVQRFFALLPPEAPHNNA